MAASVRRSLERVSLLVRGLALLLGVMAAAQSYARGGGALASTLVGCAVCAAAYVVLALLLRRYRRYLEAPEPEPVAPVRRRRERKRSGRRVLTGEGER